MLWTDWVTLDQPSDQVGPAVYQMRLLVSDKPFPIPRMVATDPGGMLVIGETGAFAERLRKFRRATENGTASHSEGQLWYLIATFSPVKDMATTIEYRYMPLSCKAAATRREAELLKDYIVRFGEPPPLNGAIPERCKANTWHTIE